MSEVHNHYEPQQLQYATIRQQRGGINIIEAFLLLFVAFKLAHIISWSWIIVLAPGWLPVLAAILMSVFGKAVRGIIQKRLRNRW